MSSKGKERPQQKKTASKSKESFFKRVAKVCSPKDDDVVSSDGDKTMDGHFGLKLAVHKRVFGAIFGSRFWIILGPDFGSLF